MNVQTLEGSGDPAGYRIAVVVSRWNELVTNALRDGALDTLRQAGVGHVTVVYVPGTWEIPVVAKALMKEHHGLVALGCILQGATTHAQILAGDVGSALMSLQMETGQPVTWGILTPETQEQALERAGMKLGNKGREAAGALLETLATLNALRH